MEQKIKTQLYRIGNPSNAEQRTAYLDYQVAMFQRLSDLEIVAIRPFKFPFLLIKPMHDIDRLGNPNLDFPIGITFGEWDSFGSDHCGKILLKNRHFFTG